MESCCNYTSQYFVMKCIESVEKGNSKALMNNNSVCSDDGMCIILLEWNGDFMCYSCMPLPYGNTQPALYVFTPDRERQQ